MTYLHTRGARVFGAWFFGVMALLIALASCASASEVLKRTEHTYQLKEGVARPSARLEDVTWLVGFWRGEAFGEKFEETWNPPSGGSMVGLFKLLDKDAVNFYEILLIVEEENSLAMKVKHFSADFTAWESKEDYVTFPLVALKKNEIHFSGLSFYRQESGDIHAFLAMRRNGELVEEPLVFYRQQ